MCLPTRVRIGDEAVLFGRRRAKKFWRRNSRSALGQFHGKFSQALAAVCAGCISEPAMFQIIFNELSAAEMAALPKMLQLDLLAEFQIMPEDSIIWTQRTSA